MQVVGVREADFVDLFVERRERMPGVELLVRAKTNRVLGKDDADKLFDKVRKSPAQGKLVVKRLSARIKASKQAAKAMRPARQATVRPRHLKVELPAKGKAPVELTIVHVREENPPADDERRFLLTTLPVESAADAERRGTACAAADYFRVLKSGCKELENRTAERLQRAAAMVVAWRIRARLGRELPAARDPVLGRRTSGAGAVRRDARTRRKTLERPSSWSPPSAATASGIRQARKWYGYLQLAAFHQELRDEYR